MSRTATALALILSLTAAGPAVAGEAVPTSTAGSQLRALAVGPDVRRLYDLVGWQAVWSPDRTAALAGAFADAPRHAITPPSLEPQTTGGESENARDLRISRQALSYAMALAHGSTDPSAAHAIFTLRRNERDVVAGLAQALRGQTVSEWFRSLAPQDADYRALSDAYLRERAAIGDHRTRIATGPPIRPGDRDPRLPALADALARAGAPTQGDVNARYGPDLQSAVRSFQRSAGLRVDGVVGPDTLDALNAGPFERARQLAVNLERRRWLARDPSPTRIDVNIAAARLTYRRDGDVEWTGRVVAGAPGHETPQLEEQFDRLVINPPWYVPASIAEAEILPHGAAYLAAHDMYVVEGRVIQRPGPKGALGRVKFDMQNRFAIYLHDTPAKALFAAADRHRSHGCVRVEDAVAFARKLASEYEKGEPFEAVLDSGETGAVRLEEMIAVRLLYHTAFVDAGEVRFRPDVYGWDEVVARRLGFDAAPPRGRAAITIDLGP